MTPILQLSFIGRISIVDNIVSWLVVIVVVVSWRPVTRWKPVSGYGLYIGYDGIIRRYYKISTCEELWEVHGVLHHFGFEIVHAGQLPVLTRTSMSYYCQPDVRNSYKFVILNFLANSSAVSLQFLDAYHRPFSVGIPTVFVDEGGFLASYLFLWLSRLPKNQTITTPVNLASTPHLRQVSHVTYQKSQWHYELVGIRNICLTVTILVVCHCIQVVLRVASPSNRYWSVNCRLP